MNSNEFSAARIKWLIDSLIICPILNCPPTILVISYSVFVLFQDKKSQSVTMFCSLVSKLNIFGMLDETKNLRIFFFNTFFLHVLKELTMYRWWVQYKIQEHMLLDTSCGSQHNPIQYLRPIPTPGNWEYKNLITEQIRTCTVVETF